MARRHTNAVQLHDVADVEAFAKNVYASYAARTSTPLTEEEREDAISQLTLDAIHMSGVRNGRYAYAVGAIPTGIYDPNGTISFSTLLGWHLPRRLVDHLRREKGDTRNKHRAELVPYEPQHNDMQVDYDDFVDQIANAASAVEDLKRLSARSHKILRDVVIPISAGQSQDEVAERLNTTRTHVGSLLEDVRNELLGLTLHLDDDPAYVAVPPTTDEVVEAMHTTTGAAKT